MPELFDTRHSIIAEPTPQFDGARIHQLLTPLLHPKAEGTQRKPVAFGFLYHISEFAMAVPVGPSVTTTNDWGQKVTTTHLSDGTLQVVTQDGGDEGAHRPTTKTEIVQDPAWANVFRPPQDQGKPLPPPYKPRPSISPTEQAILGVDANGNPTTASDLPPTTMNPYDPSGLLGIQLDAHGKPIVPDKPSIPSGDKPGGSAGNQNTGGLGASQPDPALADKIKGIYGSPGSTVTTGLGTKTTKTVQSDGTTIITTQGGGSDGGDRPWIRTEIDFPAESGRPPLIGYGESAVTTGYWTNPDGTTTTLLDRNGQHEVRINGLTNHTPWSQTYDTDDKGNVVTATKVDGITTTQNSGTPGVAKTSQRLPDGSDRTVTTVDGNIVAIDKYGLDDKGKFVHTQTTYDPNGLATVTQFDNPQPGAQKVTQQQGNGQLDTHYVYPDGTHTPGGLDSPPEDRDGVQGGIDTVKGIWHDGTIVLDTLHNIYVAPVEDAIDPGTNHQAPTHGIIETGLAALDIGLLAADGLGAAASAVDRAAAIGAGARAARDAVLAGATKDEALAAARAAIKDYRNVPSGLGDGTGLPRGHGPNPDLPNPSSPNVDGAGLNPHEAPPTGDRPTAPGAGGRGNGLPDPAPNADGLTDRTLPGEAPDPNAPDPELSPNDPSAQPNTSGLNPTPLDPLLDAMQQDLGATWEQGKNQFQQFLANSRAKLDTTLDAILERQPALAGVVNSIRNAEEGLGLGGTEARNAGGASRGGDLDSPSSGGGGGGRGPGDRGPTDPPPQDGGLGDETPEDRPAIEYRYNSEDGLWYGYDINEKPHAMPKGVQPLEGGRSWHGPKPNGEGSGYVTKEDWAVFGRRPRRYRGQEYTDLAEEARKATPIPPGASPHMLRIGENGVEARALPGADTLKSQARRFIGEGLDRAEIEVENVDRAKVGRDQQTIVSEQGSIGVRMADGTTVTINPDFIVYDPETKTVKIIDSKFGKGAVYTDNQLDAYPILAKGNVKLSDLKLSQSVKDKLRDQGIKLDTQISGVETHPWNNGIMPDPAVLARATTDFADSAAALQAAGGELGESASQALAFLKTWNQEASGEIPGKTPLSFPIVPGKNQLGPIALPISSTLTPAMLGQRPIDPGAWITGVIRSGLSGLDNVAATVFSNVALTQAINPMVSQRNVDQSQTITISVQGTDQIVDADIRKCRAYLPLGRRL
ncbi:hypothetical protein [Nocardia sp. NBC_01327]|uniref:hypothetical protein n=1 Tax=Nocardia sp. NBC_01327 TaxID=2903593 RepID=UPI002E12268F|nr:hypothetical protein OG326_10390 [Nocardia sp. NBC_01327]